MGICVGLRLPVEEGVFFALLPREGTLEEADHVRLGEGIFLDEGEYNRLLEVDVLELLHRAPFFETDPGLLPPDVLLDVVFQALSRGEWAEVLQDMTGQEPPSEVIVLAILGRSDEFAQEDALLKDLFLVV